MLRKLMKYDMKPVVRVWWILAVAVFGLSVVGAFVMRFIISNAEYAGDSLLMTLLYVVGVLFLVLCFVGIIGSFVVTAILVYARYYKNFFTDEGYLTFTLPVSRKDLLLSKTLNAFIWLSANGVLLILCALVFFLIAPPATIETGIINPVVFETIGIILSGLWKLVGGWLIAYIILGILILCAMTLFSINLIHFCITVASVTAKKLKLLLAIGVYYAANTIISIASQVFGTFGIIIMGEGFSILLQDATKGKACLVIMLIMMLVLAFVSAFAAVMYFITRGSLERKLNLA